MILDVVLISIFGEEYEQVAPHFSILFNESVATCSLRRHSGLWERWWPRSPLKGGKRTGGLWTFSACLWRRDRDGQLMPDRQLTSEIVTLIVAGHETTASTLNWVWYLLAQTPEAKEKLSGELSTLLGTELIELGDLPKFTYTRQVIEEAMRLYPPGWLMTRKPIKDDQLGEYFVPGGMEICISPYLIQRHPALCDAPDRFNPDRFEPGQLRDRHPLTMLPFSAGPRKWIGKFFAGLEMQIHVMTIAKQLWLRCVGGTQLELDAGLNLRNKYDCVMVPVTKEFAPRHAV
jgi:cytochrome P450